MVDTTTPPPKTPGHLRVIGVLSLLWNSIGALDFTMTLLRNETYLKDFTPEQRAYFSGFPFWALLTWGIATWGSFVAAGSLLGRKPLAVQLYLVSTICMVATNVYSYVLSDGLKVMGAHASSAVVFSGVIFVVSVLEVIYARAMHRRGMLR